MNTPHSYPGTRSYIADHLIQTPVYYAVSGVGKGVLQGGSCHEGRRVWGGGGFWETRLAVADCYLSALGGNFPRSSTTSPPEIEPNLTERTIHAYRWAWRKRRGGEGVVNYYYPKPHAPWTVEQCGDKIAS